MPTVQVEWTEDRIRLLVAMYRAGFRQKHMEEYWGISRQRLFNVVKHAGFTPRDLTPKSFDSQVENIRALSDMLEDDVAAV